jgi:hypothetical protein
VPAERDECVAYYHQLYTFVDCRALCDKVATGPAEAGRSRSRSREAGLVVAGLVVAGAVLAVVAR